MNSQPKRIIAIFNQAGGVAKTTLTHNLGYHLAQRKHRVLLIDMDPQASLTKFMGLVPAQLDKTVADAINVQYFFEKFTSNYSIIFELY